MNEGRPGGFGLVNNRDIGVTDKGVSKTASGALVRWMMVSSGGSVRHLAAGAAQVVHASLLPGHGMGTRWRASAVGLSTLSGVTLRSWSLCKLSGRARIETLGS